MCRYVCRYVRRYVGMLVVRCVVFNYSVVAITYFFDDPLVNLIHFSKFFIFHVCTSFFSV